MWKMSRRTPDGKAPRAAKSTLTRGRRAPVTATGNSGTTGDAQHAHVQRTQNAGQPLSWLDSLVSIPQFSGITSALTPLASAITKASSAMNSTRRIRSMVYHGKPRRPAQPWAPQTIGGETKWVLNWNSRFF